MYVLIIGITIPSCLVVPCNSLIFRVYGHLSHRDDERTVESYNLEAGATLHLVLALRGGSCSRNPRRARPVTIHSI